MISYEDFKKFMDTYKSICEKEDKLDNALHEISPDFGGFHQPDVHDMIIEMLKMLMKDGEDGWDGWIDYYIYELNWGEDWKKGMVVDRDGNDIPLKTYKNLYDVIYEEYYDK